MTLINSLCVCVRSTGCVEVHNEGHGSSAADRLAALLCHCHVRHYWSRALHGQVSEGVLQTRHRFVLSAETEPVKLTALFYISVLSILQQWVFFRDPLRILADILNCLKKKNKKSNKLPQM